MLGLYQGLLGFMRRGCGRNKEDFIKPQAQICLLSHYEMAIVERIEGSSQYA
jgi:hypothetical protein